MFLNNLCEQFIEDSDDDQNDAAFFAAEAERRKKWDAIHSGSVSTYAEKNASLKERRVKEAKKNPEEEEIMEKKTSEEEIVALKERQASFTSDRVHDEPDALSDSRMPVRKRRLVLVSLL